MARENRPPKREKAKKKWPKIDRKRKKSLWKIPKNRLNRNNKKIHK